MRFTRLVMRPFINVNLHTGRVAWSRESANRARFVSFNRTCYTRLAVQSETQLERTIKPRITNGFLSTRWRSSSSFFEKRGKKKKKKILCFAIIASDRFFDFSYPIYRYDSFRILSFFFFFLLRSLSTSSFEIFHVIVVAFDKNWNFIKRIVIIERPFMIFSIILYVWFILARIYLILLCNNSIVPYFE